MAYVTHPQLRDRYHDHCGDHHSGNNQRGCGDSHGADWCSYRDFRMVRAIRVKVTVLVMVLANTDWCICGKCEACVELANWTVGWGAVAVVGRAGGVDSFVLTYVMKRQAFEAPKEERQCKN